MTRSAILTSAHCFDDLTDLDLVWILFGYGRTEEEELEAGFANFSTVREETRRRIKKVSVHSAYLPKKESYNDLAVVIVDNPIKYSAKIRKICLPAPVESEVNMYLCFVLYHY